MNLKSFLIRTVQRLEREAMACQSMADYLRDEAEKIAPGSKLELSVLTPAERMVLGHLVLKASNKQIAKALNVSERTIKFHVSNILTKYGAANRHEVALNLLLTSKQKLM